MDLNMATGIVILCYLIAMVVSIMGVAKAEEQLSLIMRVCSDDKPLQKDAQFVMSMDNLGKRIKKMKLQVYIFTALIIICIGLIAGGAGALM